MALESYTVRIDSEMLDEIKDYVFATRKSDKTTAQEVINNAIREHVECVIRARMKVRSMDAGKGAA